ncbi:nucleolar complex protein 4 homolog [Lampetra planeri]
MGRGSVRGSGPRRRAAPRLQEAARAVLGSPRHANRLLELLEALESEVEEEVVAGITACSGLFASLVRRGAIHGGALPAEEEDGDEEAAAGAECSAEEKYEQWLRHRYNDCTTQLLQLLSHDSSDVRELALCALMKLVQTEGHHPLGNRKTSAAGNFPYPLFKAVLDRLLEEETPAQLLGRFQEFLQHHDTGLHTLTALRSRLRTVAATTAQGPGPGLQEKAFLLLTAVQMPSEKTELSLLVKGDDTTETKVTDIKEHRKVFENTWLELLKHKLPQGLYKRVLVILHDRVMPHMRKPPLLMDFLKASYDIGGAVSLLALNGLFVLIHQYNLEYPDFYKKLYSLLEPSIFHVKYRARFFHLADLFLSSTHLPAYLVLAFVKRLSRLSLTAPPHALLLLLPFIGNLVRRHPSSRVLLHRAAAGLADVTSDPYAMEEEDPAKSGASDSSLWEIQSLQRHYHPDVATAATALTRPLSDVEEDLSPLLELSSTELFEREVKKKIKNVPLEFELPQGLLGKKGDTLTSRWTL